MSVVSESHSSYERERRKKKNREWNRRWYEKMTAQGLVMLSVRLDKDTVAELKVACRKHGSISLAEMIRLYVEWGLQPKKIVEEAVASKKVYEAVARVFDKYRPVSITLTPEHVRLDNMLKELATFFEKDNAKFDKEKFLKKSKYGA